MLSILENSRSRFYWQRTAYFWALIAAAFAGYFAVLSADHIDTACKSFYAFVLACAGFVFSIAWFLVNRGSKFWQENWERHVDLLEDAEHGPLYKTILQGEISARRFVGGGPVSVSRVNQWVAVFIVVIWFVLGVVQALPLCVSTGIAWLYIAVAIVTLIAVLLLVFNTESTLAKGKSSFVINREIELQYPLFSCLRDPRRGL